MSLTALFASAALALAAAQSGGATPPEDSTTVAGVEVNAPPAKQTISEFVRDISEETRSGRLARWNKTICPATVGLQRKYAEYLNDRLASTALSLGMKVGKPGCRPDILILVTSEADVLLKELVADRNDVFAVKRWSDDRTSSGGSQSLEDFLQTPRPVRWWHVSEEVPAMGQPFDGSGKRVKVDATRLRSTMRDDFNHVIIIVDANMAKGVSYQALTDYITMVALAQLNPNTSVEGVPTVLNLFAARDEGRTMPDSLTDWDRAYLKGLYGQRADTPDGRRQRGRIVGSVESRGADGGKKD